jgi:hypothetical protein
MRAALKQALRDQSTSLSPQEIDKILDMIQSLTELIKELERNY